MVRSEPVRGKGSVVRRMFGDIDADIFVLVDGDGTYPAERALEMISYLIEGPLDMVSGARAPDQEAAYRPGHRFGNQVITAMVGLIFVPGMAGLGARPRGRNHGTLSRHGLMDGA